LHPRIFPHLAIQLGAGFQQLVLLPASFARWRLQVVAQQVAQEQGFNVALVVAVNDVVVFEPRGRPRRTTAAPGGSVLTGVIVLDLPSSPDMVAHQRELQALLRPEIHRATPRPRRVVAYHEDEDEPPPVREVEVWVPPLLYVVAGLMTLLGICAFAADDLPGAAIFGGGGLAMVAWIAHTLGHIRFTKRWTASWQEAR
jgi:hypothetical protein